MKRVLFFLLAVVSLAVTPLLVSAADMQVHGDFNNRFMLGSNHDEWFNGSGGGPLEDGSVTNLWGEAKYRLWADFSTNNGKVKGVYAAEWGALEYGAGGSVGKSAGGGFSGDAVNIETRWLYTDFKLPWNDKLGVKMGLFPLKLNKYFWEETQMGVQLYGGLSGSNFIFGWTRGDEYRSVKKNDDTTSLDSIYAKVDFKPADNFKMNIWADYLFKNLDGGSELVGVSAKQGEWYEAKLMKAAELDIFTIGLGGDFKSGNFFGGFDFIYQGGSVDKVSYKDYLGNTAPDDNYDLNAWFARLDLGYNFCCDMKLTYRFWYASGDDDSDDSDFNGYMAVDVDTFDSVVLMEGPYTDDDYFVETPYIGDKGFIMNELLFAWKTSKKTTIGGGLLYMMLAEDLEYKDNNGKSQSDDALGLEVNAYVKYKLYDNLEFAINAGYLFAGDAMDYWESDKDGNADEDIFVSTARVRYNF